MLKAAFDVIPIVLAVVGILGLSYYLGCWSFGYYKLREFSKVLPNCPFPLAWLKNKAEPVFVLPQYNVKFELRRGTKTNGIFGVVGVSLCGVGPFKDGTNMFKLNQNVEKLAKYLRDLGYEVKDDYGILRDLKDMVAKINTLEYLELPESQE